MEKEELQDLMLAIHERLTLCRSRFAAAGLQHPMLFSLEDDNQVQAVLTALEMAIEE